jgi:hypothetical protein
MFLHISRQQVYMALTCNAGFTVVIHVSACTGAPQITHQLTCVSAQDVHKVVYTAIGGRRRLFLRMSQPPSTTELADRAGTEAIAPVRQAERLAEQTERKWP